MTATATVVVSASYGDEGKGKIVSYLAMADDPDVIARAAGPNCGHTVVHEGKKYGLSMIPSGLINPRSRLLLGAGTLVDANKFLSEIQRFGVGLDRIGIDHRATLITQSHIDEDSSSAFNNKIGTTKCGVGPAQAARASRTATKVFGDSRLLPYLADVPTECNRAKKLLLEGAQGFYLSNLYSDDWPNCTSKDTSTSSLCADVGIGPKKVKDVALVVKSYTTRVGNGHLLGEMTYEQAVAKGYDEYGVVTGRKRRVSEIIDYDALRYSAMVNGATYIALTKIDVRFPGNSGVTAFDKLTPDARCFILNLELQLDLPVSLIGTGPSSMEMIDRR